MKRVELWLECARIYSATLANPHNVEKVSVDTFCRGVDQMVERAAFRNFRTTRDAKGRFTVCPKKEDREIVEMADALSEDKIKTTLETAAKHAVPHVTTFEWTPERHPTINPYAPFSALDGR